MRDFGIYPKTAKRQISQFPKLFTGKSTTYFFYMQEKSAKVTLLF